VELKSYQVLGNKEDGVNHVRISAPKILEVL
jgi:hypothetical protein